MAQLKDLIVNGPSRFIGDVCATTFTGNLAGNANTATNATNAGMIAGLSVHSGRNNEANKIVRTDGNGYLQVGYINSSSGHEKNASNPTYVWGSNSSDSYLRSYQTSSLSVNYATSSGSCSGNAATATKASSAGDADKLDGVHYQNILERQYSGSGSSGTATGWFRIAETLTTDGAGITFLLAIQRSYHASSNESYLFSISISYFGGISITQLSGYANTRLITKIRVEMNNSKIAYVDLYIDSSTANNNYYWYTVGCAKSYTAWTANPTLVGNAYEFTTVQGCKSDRGFTGYLTGNATSASKWSTARTITLTGSVTGSVSIDGSANVSLATTTNHTHTFASLTSKPTTLSGYGITDALPLNGTAANAAQLGGKAASMYFVNNTNRGAVDFDTQYINGFEYVSGSSTNGGVPYAIIYTANYEDAGMQANFGRDSALQYRSRGGSRWFDWRTVYDDHNANNASTVWSAKRLATPYNLICPYTWARNNDITGTLVLSLPYGFNSMMQCIELTVYDYSSSDGIQGATKFFINGYNYSGNNGIWINPYVFRIGNKNVRVRLGYYNNKCCILIGETNTGWNYPRICVDKVYGSFSESPYAYKDDDWSCAILQDESKITHVKTASDTPLYAPCYTRAGLPYVTDNDVAAKYLKLTGGTLTGSVIMRGIDTNLIRDIVFDGTGGWARGLITLRVDGVDKFNIGAYGGYTVGASNNGIYYGYIGCNSYDGLNLRISATSLSWGDNSILHTGNYNSYAPKLDGTGASGTWGISISGNAATATNADKLDGYHASYANSKPWGTIPVITDSGYMDVGKHFEFHYDNTTGPDYSTVLACTGNHRNIVNLPSKSGTLALLTDNVASATKLATSRTIWGQSFNGTGNVSGNLTDVGSITPATDNSHDIGTSSNQFRWVYAQGLFAHAGNVLRLGANNTDHMRIITNGNVGIGIENPQYKLHVVGTINASDVLMSQEIELCSSTPFIDFRYGNSTDNYTSRIIEGLSGQLTVTGKLRVGLGYTTSTNHAFHVVGDGFFTENIITESDFKSLGNAIIDGYVGIGTSSPSYKLHVSGSGYFTENVITGNDFISYGGAIIYGNVGIGTQRPDYNLDVDGNMRITGPIWLDVLNSNGKYFISTEDNDLLGITYDGRDQNPAFLMNSLGYVYLNCDTLKSPAYPLVVNGTISCTKLLQTSDIKYKTNIKQIEYEEALKIIENLNPVTWDWNENTVEIGSSSGFVAQEAEEFIPNAISRDNENNLSLDYTQLHSYEIKVIQEQQKEIIKLKEKLKILEKLIS